MDSTDSEKIGRYTRMKRTMKMTMMNKSGQVSTKEVFHMKRLSKNALLIASILMMLMNIIPVLGHADEIFEEAVEMFPGKISQLARNDATKLVGAWTADTSIGEQWIGTDHCRAGDLLMFFPECAAYIPENTSNAQDAIELTCDYESEHVVFIQDQKLYWELDGDQLSLRDDSYEKAFSFHRYYTKYTEFSDYEYEDGRVRYTYRGSFPIVVIPEWIYGWSTLRDGVEFCVHGNYTDNIYAIFFPNGLRTLYGEIGSLPELAHISVPFGLQTIDKLSIYECPMLKELHLPSNITLGDKGLTFIYAGIEKIYLNVPEIKEMFLSCENLRTVAIGCPYVTLDSPFYECGNLENVILDTMGLTVKNTYVVPLENVRFSFVKSDFGSIETDENVLAERIGEGEYFYTYRLIMDPIKELERKISELEFEIPFIQERLQKMIEKGSSEDIIQSWRVKLEEYQNQLDELYTQLDELKK